MARIARKGWPAGTTSSREVSMMSSSCRCSSPRIAPSLYLICRYYCIREGHRRTALASPSTRAGLRDRRLFQHPAGETRGSTITPMRVGPPINGETSSHAQSDCRRNRPQRTKWTANASDSLLGSSTAVATLCNRHGSEFSAIWTSEGAPAATGPLPRPKESDMRNDAALSVPALKEAACAPRGLHERQARAGCSGGRGTKPSRLRAAR